MMQARRKWSDNFKVPLEKNCQPRISSQARMSLRNEGEIKNFQKNES